MGAAEDSSMYLWAFGETAPRCTLPRCSTDNDARRRPPVPGMSSTPAAAAVAASTRPGTVHGSHDGGIAAGAQASPQEPTSESPGVAASAQKKCTLSWNSVGDRLLGVGSHTGVSLWTVGEGRGAVQSSVVATGSAHAKTTCGIFVSPGAVLATAGSRSDSDGKSWPYAAAGLCIWDTLLPPRGTLVAHDGAADAVHQMQPDYVCLTWDSSQQRILCGTKSGELRIFDIRQRRVSNRIPAHDAAIRHCFLLPATRRFVTLSATAELKIWSCSDLDCLETLPRLHTLRGVGSVLGKTSALTCATLLSESHLVTGGQDGVILLTRL